MDKLITALGPVFAAALGIQQLGEILSPIIDKINPDYKKIVLGLISLTLGVILAFVAELHVLQSLGVVPAAGLNSLDAIVTGFIISGGTESVNSIVKFLKYKKEEVKNEAAFKTLANVSIVAPNIGPIPAEPALAAINKK